MILLNLLATTIHVSNDNDSSSPRTIMRSFKNEFLRGKNVTLRINLFSRNQSLDILRNFNVTNTHCCSLEGRVTSSIFIFIMFNWQGIFLFPEKNCYATMLVPPEPPEDGFGADFNLHSSWCGGNPCRTVVPLSTCTHVHALRGSSGKAERHRSTIFSPPGNFHRDRSQPRCCEISTFNRGCTVLSSNLLEL